MRLPNRQLYASSLVTCLSAFVVTSSAKAERFTVGESVSTDATKVSLILLQDDEAGIEAAIAPEKGGELSGLKIRYKGKWNETIYLARNYAARTGWTGKAPLLWPATGRNFPPDLEARRKAGEAFHDGAWIHRGKQYAMPIHGFARDLPWRIEAVGADDQKATAKLSLRDTPQTKEYYPFGFLLEVTYTLKDGTLTITYRAVASQQNDDAMPFSIGNHITFVSPLLSGSDPSAMVLTTPSTIELLKTDYGVPTGETRPRTLGDGVQLGELQRRAAVSLTGYSGNPSMAYRDPQGLAIRMSHTASTVPASPVVLFNLWGDAQGGYYSPEPWVGLQNSLVLDQGLIRLSPGDDFVWTILIEFERS